MLHTILFLRLINNQTILLSCDTQIKIYCNYLNLLLSLIIIIVNCEIKMYTYNNFFNFQIVKLFLLQWNVKIKIYYNHFDQYTNCIQYFFYGP